MSGVIHAIHILAAGIWMGGLVFTTVVVSPAFKRMNWTPPERVAVRSEVGRQYSKVARVNLTVLLLAAIFDRAAQGGSTLWGIGIALIVVAFVLAELHAQVFAPRLGAAARSGDEPARKKALRVSIGISMLNLLLSFVIAIMSI
jgi:uncharacterized membrane protein